MPIINGTYQPDTLGDAKEAQKKVFGEYSKKDMTDYSSAAYNYLMKQQEQAYNLELWNLTNQYNSPAAQMQRYQDAGLNPNLIYGQSNTASAPASASAPSFRSGNVQARKQANAVNMINSFSNIIHQAKDIYDYATYGTTAARLQNNLTEQKIFLTSRQETAQQLANYWNMWLQGRMDLPTDAPAVSRYQSQTDKINADIERVEALCKMIPDQQARLAALTALDQYRLQILKGQNDAVLNLHTGNETADAFLRAFIYFGMSKI